LVLSKTGELAEHSLELTAQSVLYCTQDRATYPSENKKLDWASYFVDRYPWKVAEGGRRQTTLYPEAGYRITLTESTCLTLDSRPVLNLSRRGTDSPLQRKRWWG